MENLDKYIEQAPELILTYGLQVVFAIIIFIIGKYLANVAKKLTTKLMNKRKIDKTVV